MNRTEILTQYAVARGRYSDPFVVVEAFLVSRLEGRELAAALNDLEDVAAMFEDARTKRVRKPAPAAEPPAKRHAAVSKSERRKRAEYMRIYAVRLEHAMRPGAWL